MSPVPDEGLAGVLAAQGMQGVSPGRTWSGEAQAAYDQALTAAGDRDQQPGPDFWVARAAAAAAIESAQMQRVANLIAWKALQTAREARGIDALPLAGDEITATIERALGIS